MNSQDPLDELMSWARAPLSEWPSRYPEYQAAGYLCSYVPAEILHAAGWTPVRVRGTAAPLRQVDAHLQSFTCALCRSSFDQALDGKLGFLAGTVFAHTCDTMQALADLWRMHPAAARFVAVVMQPSNLSTPAARPYLIAELERFRQEMATLAGTHLSDDDLLSSISLYDETRRLVGELQALRDRLSPSQFHAILDAAQKTPRELFNPILTDLVSELGHRARRPAGPRLFLVGSVLDEPRLLDLIAELGAQVNGDDLCSGSRHFLGQVGTAGEPIEALADYYLQRPLCPTKYRADHDPARYLLDQVQQSGAQGVVFVIQKFCEPYAFDYGLIRSQLDRAGVPHLLLEMEHTPSLEALRTRLQAFVEML